MCLPALPTLFQQEFEVTRANSPRKIHHPEHRNRDTQSEEPWAELLTVGRKSWHMWGRTTSGTLGMSWRNPALLMHCQILLQDGAHLPKLVLPIVVSSVNDECKSLFQSLFHCNHLTMVNLPENTSAPLPTSALSYSNGYFFKYGILEYLLTFNQS